MDRDVEGLLSFAQTADTIDEIDRLTASAGRALKPFGVTSLAANMIIAPGERFSPRILFGERWRAWSDHYVQNRLHLSDPAVRMLREQTRPFTWSEALARYRSRDAERVLDACWDHTGSRDGFVVPVRDTDGALLSATFSGDLPDLDARSRQALHLAGYYYAVRGREILAGVRLDPDCPFSPRQLQCLQGVHEGRTDGEIAAALGVSHNTVHNHIEAAKRLLNVSKRSRAAFEAWRRGWLD